MNITFEYYLQDFYRVHFCAVNVIQIISNDHLLLHEYKEIDASVIFNFSSKNCQINED